MADRDKMRARREAMKLHATEQINSDTQELSEDSPLHDIVKNISKQSERVVKYASADKFTYYPDHSIILKLHEGYKRDAMVESIKKDGIIEPICVWPKDNQLIILAGHNRCNIAEELGIQVPYLEFTDIDEKKAERIVIITNLQNRQYTEMLPSELSRMLRRLIDSYDDTYKEDIYIDINSEFNLSKQKVLQYLRLGKLNSKLLKLLDEGAMPMTAAYNLAYVSDEKQQFLLNFMHQNDITKISLNNVNILRKRDKKDWDEEFLRTAFGLAKAKKVGRTATTIKVPIKKIQNLMTVDELKDAESVIESSLSIRKELYSFFEAHNQEYSNRIVQEALAKYFEENRKCKKYWMRNLVCDRDTKFLSFLKSCNCNVRKLSENIVLCKCYF